MSAGPSFSFGKVQVPFVPGETMLTSLVGAGMYPTGGGCLCFGGDCPHCVAVVDGVAYVRTCQTRAVEGAVVEPHPHDGKPAVPEPGGAAAIPIAYKHADLVVIGGGFGGRAAAASASKSAGLDVLLFEADEGNEVIGIYDGPRVVVRTPEGMISVECGEIAVATGAAEIQPVCPGNDLEGILTARAAEHLHAAGVELGTIVAVGDPPRDVPCIAVAGDLIRFEGAEGRVEAVVVATGEGEQRHECDAAVIGLGLYPRDALARMGAGLPITVVGDAAIEPTIPPCPQAGVVCPCSSVGVDDLQSVWDRGFHEMELLKRATLAGTGTCQGAACLPYLRSFLADRGAELQPAFTARPVARQITMAEAAAGMYPPAIPRTALHDEHLALGATMDRIGGWWRPWTYGNTEAECDAVRERVSIGDVSTLGKMIVTGPDAEAFLQYVYPTNVATIEPGRSRYVLMLNERGYIFDDGLVCRVNDEKFLLTFTSGGASVAEMWMRDWGSHYDVRIANLTMSLGAINVTGPLAKELLARAGLTDPPPYMGHSVAEIAGVPCTIYRLSFTGELSFELHHSADRSVELWRTLMDLGADLGIAPHGLDALTRLRLEKGHVIVGQDTDYDSTPRRIHHGWAVNMNKGDFIGRHALTRTDRISPDRRLVGLETDGEAPIEGAVIWHDNTYAGYVTSSTWSPTLGKGVMLGWVDYFDDGLPKTVTIDGLTARRVPVPFYDPDGERARA